MPATSLLKEMVAPPAGMQAQLQPLDNSHYHHHRHSTSTPIIHTVRRCARAKHMQSKTFKNVYHLGFTARARTPAASLQVMRVANPKAVGSSQSMALLLRRHGKMAKEHLARTSRRRSMMKVSSSGAQVRRPACMGTLLAAGGMTTYFVVVACFIVPLPCMLCPHQPIIRGLIAAAFQWNCLLLWVPQ